jgi:hypothetical protein
MMQLLLYLAPLPIVTVHTVCALLVYRRCGRVHRPTVATLPFGGAAPANTHMYLPTASVYHNIMQYIHVTFDINLHAHIAVLGIDIF